MEKLSIRSFWFEPRMPDPPGPLRRDWILVALLTPVAVAEAVFRSDVVWPAMAFALALLTVGLLPYRRVQPFVTSMTVLMTLLVGTVVAAGFGVVDVGLYSSAVALLYPYALFRWASGREAALGLAAMLALYAVDVITSPFVVADAIGGLIVFLFPAELGAVIRFWVSARDRELTQVRSREREQLARELHDTVAHHVSAIAIQAQAGQAAAAARPEAANEVLAVIEEEAARTLTEMRTMIGALRDDATAELAPQQGLADLSGLATAVGDEPRVAVTVSECVGTLRPSVEAALYRLAQESITNSVRHARSASLIEVIVAGDGDQVVLTVSDDGEPASFGTAGGSGYGLVGMNERVAILGGTLRAGPDPGGGWIVEAVLPRHGATNGTAS